MTDELSPDELIKIGGEVVSLADLAGIDMDSVTERRMVIFPIGNFVWEIVAEPEPPKLKVINEKVAVTFPCKCLRVDFVKDPSDAPNGNPAELLGEIHRETFFWSDLESIGYMKAFMTDIGCKVKGKVTDPATYLATVGLRFSAPIQKRKDQNDTDKVYTSLNRTKIVPESKMKKVA